MISTGTADSIYKVFNQKCEFCSLNFRCQHTGMTSHEEVSVISLTRATVPKAKVPHNTLTPSYTTAKASTTHGTHQSFFFLLTQNTPRLTFKWQPSVAPNLFKNPTTQHLNPSHTTSTMLTASPVTLGFRDSRPSPNVPSPLRRPATAGALTSRSTRRKGRSRTSSRGSPPLVTASAAARSPSPDPLVRHTLFTHGEGRHGVDPRLVQRATPAAAGPPALHATRKRVIGMGFGAATANRGLMPAPEARRPTRRRRRGKRSAKKKQPAEATSTTQPEQQQQQQAADSHAYHKYDAAIAQAKQAKAAIAAELQHLLKSPSSLARTPKTVMISTAARSSPSTWSGNAKGGRDSPGTGGGPKPAAAIQCPHPSHYSALPCLHTQRPTSTLLQTLST